MTAGYQSRSPYFDTHWWPIFLKYILLVNIFKKRKENDTNLKRPELIDKMQYMIVKKF